MTRKLRVVTFAETSFTCSEASDHGGEGSREIRETTKQPGCGQVGRNERWRVTVSCATALARSDRTRDLAKRLVLLEAWICIAQFAIISPHGKAIPYYEPVTICDRSSSSSSDFLSYTETDC